ARGASNDPALTNPITGIAVCCARAASGHAAAPPSAASNSRRPMVTVIRPSRARCVEGRIARRERAVFTFAEGWTAALAAQQKDERLSPLSPLASKARRNHLANRALAKTVFLASSMTVTATKPIIRPPRRPRRAGRAIRPLSNFRGFPLIGLG